MEKQKQDGPDIIEMGEGVKIVDDVLTTGTTVRVLANLLIENDVERVDVWCATRAVQT